VTPLARSLFGYSAFLAVTLASGAASAQQPVATSPVEDGGDKDHYCHDHWFAVDRCSSLTWDGPRLMLGGDLGVAKMDESGPFGFGTGIGSVTNAGPAWGVRVGVELLPWLALEARYVAAYTSVQSSVAPTGSLGYLLTGAEAVVRVTAPFPYVHPYIFGGPADYDVHLVGSNAAKAGSPLYSSVQPGIALGFGVDVPITWHLSLGAEATYHFMLGEDFSNDMTNGIDGGDISTFDLVMRARL
jgi:hypothetical protein